VATERRTHADRAEVLEKEWAKREADLKAREQELAALRDAVAKFPDELKRATAAEVAVATTALKKQLETAAALDKKDAETNLKLANNATAAVQAEVNRLQATITDLNRQLAEAHRATQTVAEKALDSASGRTAMEALQQTMGRSETALPTGRR
jgi:paraquat-inducible protein B